VPAIYQDLGDINRWSVGTITAYRMVAELDSFG